MQKNYTEDELNSFSAERVKEIAKSYDLKTSFKLKNIRLILKAQKGNKKTIKSKKEEYHAPRYYDIPLDQYKFDDLNDRIKNEEEINRLISYIDSSNKNNYKFNEGDMIGIREDIYDISTVPDYLIYVYRDGNKLKYVFEPQTHIDSEHKATHFYRIPPKSYLKHDEEYDPEKEEQFNEEAENIYHFPFIGKTKEKL